MLKKLFFFLLKKYSKTEKQRHEIYNVLWCNINNEYNEQTAFGNVYNMNIEVLMSNSFVKNKVYTKDKNSISMLKSGLNSSFDKSILYIENEKPKL